MKFINIVIKVILFILILFSIEFSGIVNNNKLPIIGINNNKLSIVLFDSFKKNNKKVYLNFNQYFNLFKNQLIIKYLIFDYNIFIEVKFYYFF
jgi:hypothetical protein